MWPQLGDTHIKYNFHKDTDMTSVFMLSVHHLNIDLSD